VVHHRNGDLSPVQANTTTAARVGIPQANSRGAARAAWPVRAPDLRERLPRSAGIELQAGTGRRQPHRGAASSGRHG